VTFLAQYKAQGIDPRGYDMKHFVDDIEAIRQQLNYEKIALIGNSFGSQWALSYIRMYPSKVDRALFSGIEPMENNYDDPDGRWKVLEKIAADAEADPVLSKQIPEGGLMEAFKTVITRLENNPVSVQLIDEDSGEVEIIVVGADDLRYNLMNEGDRSYTSEIESWPKYILEMYQGDFRLLASNSIGRIYNSSSKMINPLVNNSLGISKQREVLLDSRESKRWLGDVNVHYTATRDVCPAPKVSDEFLQPVKNNIPMILIHGDMDMSTPHGNATELMEYLENGHLISVKRGFHNAKRALIFKDSLLIDKVYGFMNLDFEQDSFQDFSETIPSEYELPAFKFWPIDGESLYDRYSK
jgi:pimeloyl-ACP methyl ester carboxylesterase